MRRSARGQSRLERRSTLGPHEMAELLAALRALGHDLPPPRPLPRGDLSSREAASTATAEFAAAERSLGDPLVGLHAGARVRPRGALVHLILSAATLRESLRAIARFGRVLIDSLEARLEEDGAVARLVYRFDDEELAADLHLVDYALMATTRVVRSAMGASFRLDHVRLRHRSLDAPEYERAFGCEVRFGQADDSLVFARASLARAPRVANPVVAAEMEKVATALVDRMNTTRLCRDRVAAIVREGLAAGIRVDRKTVARRLGASAATLVRRLAAEGTTFREVRERIRWDTARALLANSRLKLESIAIGVGFADGAAFSKALRKRFGCSPSAYRSRLSREAARGGKRGRRQRGSTIEPGP